jgi:hypothetical protein
VDLGRNFAFIIHMQSVGINTVGRTPLTENQLAAYTRNNNKNRINTDSIPLEWDSKHTVRAGEDDSSCLDCAATVIGGCTFLLDTFRPELARIG